MSGAPAWRRLDPRSGRARLLAGLLAASALAILAALALAPLVARRAEGLARIAAIEAEAARIERAAAEAAARRAAPDPAAAAEAGRWLDAAAPALAAEPATLALIAEAQRLAAGAGARVLSVAPLDPAEAAGDLADRLAAAGVSAAAAEVRLAADHATLARLLGTPPRPPARLVAIEVAAASADPFAEAERLSVRLVLAALRRDPG